MSAARIGQGDRHRHGDRPVVGRSGIDVGPPAPAERLPHASPRGAFTIVELLIVIAIVVVAFLAMSHTLVSSMKLTSVNRESALATDGLREMMETLQGVEDFATVFALYNGNPLDDPGIDGSAPGSGFAVAGLQAVDTDPDGFVGEIVFPTIGLELREDLANPALGMPRDLDGDGALDSLDHAPDDYRILPVLLRVRWKGSGAERTMEIRTLLADR